MAEEIRDYLFDASFTTIEVSGIVGMGLSISHGIIKNHGGTIEVKSLPAAHLPDGQGPEGEVGKGSEFIITLPRRV